MAPRARPAPSDIAPDGATSHPIARGVRSRAVGFAVVRWGAPSSVGFARRAVGCAVVGGVRRRAVGSSVVVRCARSCGGVRGRGGVGVVVRAAAVARRGAARLRRRRSGDGQAGARRAVPRDRGRRGTPSRPCRARGRRAGLMSRWTSVRASVATRCAGSPRPQPGLLHPLGVAQGVQLRVPAVRRAGFVVSKTVGTGRWPHVVGAEIADHCTPVSLRDGPPLAALRTPWVASHPAGGVRSDAKGCEVAPPAPPDPAATSQRPWCLRGAHQFCEDLRTRPPRAAGPPAGLRPERAGTPLPRA
jgi:hypothetical protein